MIRSTDSLFSQIRLSRVHPDHKAEIFEMIFGLLLQGYALDFRPTNVCGENGIAIRMFTSHKNPVSRHVSLPRPFVSGECDFFRTLVQMKEEIDKSPIVKVEITDGQIS